MQRLIASDLWVQTSERDFSIAACGGLNDVSHRFAYLNTSPLVGGAVRESLGGAALLDEVHRHGWA